MKFAKYEHSLTAIKNTYFEGHLRTTSSACCYIFEKTSWLLRHQFCMCQLLHDIHSRTKSLCKISLLWEGEESGFTQTFKIVRWAAHHEFMDSRVEVGKNRNFSERLEKQFYLNSWLFGISFSNIERFRHCCHVFVVHWISSFLFSGGMHENTTESLM